MTGVCPRVRRALRQFSGVAQFRMGWEAGREPGGRILGNFGKDAILPRILPIKVSVPPKRKVLVLRIVRGRYGCREAVAFLPRVTYLTNPPARTQARE